MDFPNMNVDISDKDQKTILVAEDESDLREIMADRLTEAGYKVLQAENGDQALDTALNEKPDAILLDQLMPIRAGTMVLSKIRETKWGEDVFVIMLTNVSGGTKSYVEHTKLANKYMVKSNVSIDEVLDELSAHFNPVAEIEV